MTAAEIVDAAATGPVLVFGSLPPEGRDLDLLTLALEPIEDALRSAGFVTRDRGEWARFAGGTVESVDFARSWPHAEELLDAGIPLEGHERLLRPSPAHALLLLAQMLHLQGRYPAKRVARMRRALAEDPAAAGDARGLAPAWGVAAELQQVLKGVPVERRPRPRRPRVVALSGIDGSGKSTQTRLLSQTLERLGYEVETAWSPLGSSKLLRAIFLPIRNALGRFRALQATAEVETGLPPTAGTVIRDRSRAAHFAWSTLIALANGSFHARTAARAAAAGRVVIFDRYVLDSRVRLRFLYGRGRSYRVQDAIVRALSPNPVGAFMLAVSAEESLRRKDDRWTELDLQKLVALYEELDDGTVTFLDGTRPQDELAAQIAETVWRRL